MATATQSLFTANDTDEELLQCLSGTSELFEGSDKLDAALDAAVELIERKRATKDTAFDDLVTLTSEVYGLDERRVEADVLDALSRRLFQIRRARG